MAALIQISDLTKTFPMGETVVVALDHVSFQIEKGEMVAIMGPSGSGKSTLLNLFGCLDTPTSGSYRLNNQEVQGMNDTDLSAIRNREIGFVFQSFNLLPRSTAQENVELPLVYSSIPKSVRKEKSRKALTSVGLENRIGHLPNEMSGGEQQRVAIARALVNSPSIILADEPTGSLDSSTGEEIMQLLNDLNRKGITIILVTHEEYIARKADRILYIRDGRIQKDARVNGADQT